MKAPKFLIALIFSLALAFYACDFGSNEELNNFLYSSGNEISSSSSGNEISSSSSFEENTEYPVMDSRVISYQRINTAHPDWLSGFGFVSDIDTLELWFPNIFNGEQTNVCNYFAIYSSGSGIILSYPVISQDRLFLVTANLIGNYCAQTDDVQYYAMLICDDEASSLRNKLYIDYERSYVDVDWACYDNKNVFF